MSQQRTDWTFRLGLLSLLVPILGPFVWASASRALQNEAVNQAAARLRTARLLAIVATCLLATVLAVALLGGQSVEAPS